MAIDLFTSREVNLRIELVKPPLTFFAITR